MSRAGPDSKRETSIRRLISEIIPSNPHDTREENQQRHSLLFQQIKEQLERQVRTITQSHNHQGGKKGNGEKRRDEKQERGAEPAEPAEARGRDEVDELTTDIWSS